MQTIALKTLSDRVFGSTSGYDAWERIEEMCADEFRCQPTSVTLVEDADGEEIIHIDGVPMARIVYRRGL